ncbi:MAG: hypothetical protein K0R50_1569 [Eubacterium sp.]|jgi:uncharacterized membrane-anchored protein YitT (DUF2179 family)|nr:hypothetical protein [Eubacterium sp.]
MKVKSMLPIVVMKYIFILVGSILTAIGLEVFFKAHNLIGGGLIGISVILSYLIEIPLGVIIFILNFPFILFEYIHRGKQKLVTIVFALISLIYWMSAFNADNWETYDILNSTIMGGICLGVGSGLILRYGGFLDGIEHRRIVFRFGNNYSQNNYLFILINLLIVIGAGFILGWDNTFYSLIAYIVVFKVIDFTLDILHPRDNICKKG